MSSFLRRRARRLGGALLVVVVAIASTVAGGVLPARPGHAVDTAAALTQVANWRFALVGQDYGRLFEAPSPFLHFWSLGVEVQLYVLVPLLLVMLRVLGRGSRPTLLAGVVTATVAAATWSVVAPVSSTRAYYGTDTRAIEVLAGVLVGVVLLGRPTSAGLRRVLTFASPVALAGLAWAVVGLGVDDLRIRDGHLLLVTVASAILVAAAAQSEGPLTTLLRVRPLRWLGTRSYGLYLIHWPVFLVLDPGRTGLDGWPLFAARCGSGASLLLTELVYRSVETPVRRGLPASRSRALAAAALAAAALAVAVAPIAPAGTALTAEAAGLDSIGDTTAESFAGVAGPIRVLIVGDSQMIALAQAVSDRWSDRIRIVSAIESGCGIGRGGDVRYHDRARAIFDDCPLWTPDFPARLGRFDPDLVVVGAGPWDFADRRLEGASEWLAPGDPVYDEYLLGEFAAASGVLEAADAPVLWMTAPPVEVGRLDIVPPAYPADGSERPRSLNAVIEAHADARGDDVVDYAAVLATCPGGSLDPAVRPDGVHLTRWSASAVADWFAGELAAAAGVDLGRPAATTCSPD